jgi:hypothetical protein
MTAVLECGGSTPLSTDRLDGPPQQNGVQPPHTHRPERISLFCTSPA